MARLFELALGQLDVYWRRLSCKTGELWWHCPVARPGSAGHRGLGAASAVDETRVFVGCDGELAC